MNYKLKIAVIGGTGKSGKYVVNQLLNKGYYFKLLLRNPETFKMVSPSIEITKGDARNYEDIRSLVAGCQAVVSTLGQPEGETSIFSQASNNVSKAMYELNVNRYIVTTGLSVDTPRDKKCQKVQMATDWMKSNYPQTTLDKQIEFDALQKSNLNWTLVRLPLIQQSDERRKVIVSLEDCPGDKISSTDLACFLIEQLSSETYVKKAPFISNP